MNSLRQPGRWEKFVWPVFAFLLLLALWHFAVAWSGTKIFPSPRDVVKGMVTLVHKHVLWGDITDSLRRVIVGFGLASLVGVPLGLTLGWYPAANRVVNPRHANPAPHQPHRLDSCRDPALRRRRPRCHVAYLSRCILSHRRSLRSGRRQRSRSLPAIRAQLRTKPHADTCPCDLPGRAAGDTAGPPHRSRHRVAGSGWRRKWSRSIQASATS